MMWLDILTRLLSVAAISVLGATLVPFLKPYLYFTWHPFFMTLGFVVFMTWGITSYVSNYGKQYETRDQKRSLHGIFQVLAAACILIGYMAIYLAHWSGNKSHFDGGSAGRTIHMWLGYLTLLLVAFQVVIGLRKYMIKARDGVSWAKWHGVIGPFIYLFGTITLCWGIGIFYIADEKKPQSQVNAGIGVMVLAILTFVAATVHVCTGSRKAAEADVSMHDEDGNKGSLNPSDEYRVSLDGTDTSDVHRRVSGNRQ